jgi:molybdenum ABC transporter molybdate-binding protein
MCRRVVLSRALPPLLLPLLAALTGCGAIDRGDPRVRDDEPLVIACAASNRSVMEAIMADYAAETGGRVVAQYGPSQALLAGLEVVRAADLYLPADDSFMALARERGLVAADYPLAEMRPLIAVPRGNPRGIAALDDLLDPGLRLAIANPDAAAIGAVVRAALDPVGRWRPLADHAAVVTTTVTEAATAVKLGSVDAAIVYDAVLHDFGNLEGVPVPEFATELKIASLMPSPLISACTTWPTVWTPSRSTEAMVEPAVPSALKKVTFTLPSLPLKSRSARASPSMSVSA